MKNSKDISECITDLEFENYIKNNLSNSEKNRIEQHCSFCEMCNDSLEGLSTLEKDNLFESQKEKLILNEGGKKINLWVYFSAAAAIFIVLGISFLFINKSDVNQISSNQLKLIEQTTEMQNEQTNNTLDNSAVDSLYQNNDNSELKKTPKSVELFNSEINDNSPPTEPEIANSTKVKPEKLIDSEQIKKLAKEDISSEAITEGLSSIDYSTKSLAAVDDDNQKTEERKISTDMLTSGNAITISENHFSNTNAASPASTTFTMPTSVLASPANINSNSLSETTIETIAKKSTQKDNKINEKASEELKIKAAQKFMEQKEFSKAIEQLDRIITKKSGSVLYEHALWLKALCLKNLDNLPKAMKILNEISKSNSSYSKNANDSLKVWAK